MGRARAQARRNTRMTRSACDANKRSSLWRMVNHRRPGPKPDEMISGVLHTIATRNWAHPSAPTETRASMSYRRPQQAVPTCLSRWPESSWAYASTTNTTRVTCNTPPAPRCCWSSPASPRTTRRFSGGSRSAGSAATGHGSVPSTAGERWPRINPKSIRGVTSNDSQGQAWGREQGVDVRMWATADLEQIKGQDYRRIPRRIADPGF